MIEDELRELFREEAQDHLRFLESSLLDLESADDSESRREIVDNVFRHAHSLKGAARAVGLAEVQDLGQVLEDSLDKLRDDPDSATEQTLSQVIGEFDAVRVAYERWDKGSSDAPDEPAVAVIEPVAKTVIDVSPTNPGESPRPAETSNLIDDEILAMFREELREHMDALEASLLDLEATTDAGGRRTIVNNLFRHAHSIKGSARAVGLTELQDRAQVLEDTLDEIRENSEQVAPQAIAKAIAEFDALQQTYNRWEQDGDQHADGKNTADLVDAESGTETEQTSMEAVAAATLVSQSKPTPVARSSEDRLVVRVPAARLDRMLSLAGEVRVSQRGSDSLQSQLHTINELVGAALADCKRFEEKLLRSGAANAPPPREFAESLRGQFENAVDRLRQLQSDFGKKRFREDLLVEELEQDIRTARLVPLSNLTDSMRRNVRDLVQSLGKSIQYKPDVGDILLDKAVMESLKDPFMHLVRNAVDHGIEAPSDRVKAGKPAEGTLAITAARRGESVLIRISDDGGGINFDRVREKLKQERGLDDADVAAMSKSDLSRYLFQPGFTTKQQATSVSGRGVGMDVVLDAIHRLQGTVELESSSSAGSTFLITVPVTISTARILAVRSAGQRYGIPTTSMLRTGRLDVKSLKEIEGSLVLSDDGAPVRWVDLSELLGAVSSPLSANGDLRHYLLLLHEGRKLALAVDELEDESEVILKSLEFPLADMDEVIGGTIRPDGAVQLVLDPSWLMSRALNIQRRGVRDEKKAAAQILVVDDSPTTRSILRNVLAAAGYAVHTAIDGVDAIERLRSRPFDLVVSDVEMPRMNGFELTRQVKSQFQLPVVLVTSLQKDEDRRQGLQAGADAYVVKSTFEDRGLLDILSQFV